MGVWIAVPDRDKDLSDSAFLGEMPGYKCQIISAHNESEAAERATELFFKINCPFVLVPYEPVMFVDWTNPTLRKKVKTKEGELLPYV